MIILLLIIIISWFTYAYISCCFLVFFVLALQRRLEPLDQLLHGAGDLREGIFSFFANFADDGEHSLAEANVYYTRLAEPIGKLFRIYY